MRFLKLNSLLCCALLFANACASSSFKVLNTVGRQVELLVSPDRVIMTCDDVSENREVPYGFMILVLDDENTVLGLVQGNTLPKSSCDERFRKIGSLLRKGTKIYIAGIGDLNEPRIKEEFTYVFPGHGTFHSNGRSLSFAAIMNEHGACYSAYGGEEDCPGYNFPLRK